jgi:hypothetical protein
MSIRATVGSFSESHRAQATRPDWRFFSPPTSQSDAKKANGVKATDAADAHEHILTIQNAADLEFPANAPARRADAARAANTAVQIILAEKAIERKTLTFPAKP